ncbi:MAG: hypothetical protein AAGD07_10675 [Planctomycetota bacterium]
MKQIAKELDEKLSKLDPERAKNLVSLVRDAIRRVDQEGLGWSEGYFEETSGALAGEKFAREPQGELPHRDPW